MAVFKWPVIQSSGGGGGSGEANTSSNAGTGQGLAKAKSGVNLPFKSLKAGTNVSLSSSADEITISASSSTDPQTATNTTNIATNTADIASNTTAIASKASQTDLNTANTNISNNTTSLASKLEATNILAGTNVTLNKSGNNVTINASGGGGGSATTDASDLTSGVLADARVQQSNITQHQASLSITESQISDLGTYATTAQLATKADQSSLNTTNTNVSANTTALAGKSDTSHTHPADPQVAINKSDLDDIKADGRFPLAAVTGNVTGATTLDLSANHVYLHTLTGNVTYTLDLPDTGSTYLIALTQDATGSRTVSWPASVKWAGGTAPTLSTAAGSKDVVSLLYTGTEFLGTFGKDFS